MEFIMGKRISSMFEPQDFISSMPDVVISNILDRLPIQDAVRTSILARKWRFKWTMLTQLVFDSNFLYYLSKTKGENNYVRIISRLLLHLKGVVTKFFVCIKEHSCSVLDDEDINHWMLFLSSKGIKDLTFKYWKKTPLPAHLFSCLELKHLKLSSCCWHPPTSFHGFPSLLSLKLDFVHVETENFGEFFTKFPVLEILNINSPYPRGKIKLVEIAKLTNLKVLSLSLDEFVPMSARSFSTVFELVGSFPKLQELDLSFAGCKLTEGGVIERCPATFPSLTTLKLSNIYLGNEMKLSYVMEVLRCFPNLQTLEIRTIRSKPVSTPRRCFPEADYNTMGLLQLQNAEFEVFTGSDYEVCLIKYILARSPFLKKIAIRLEYKNVERLFARKLLKLHRASPVAEIDLC